MFGKKKEESVTVSVTEMEVPQGDTITVEEPVVDNTVVVEEPVVVEESAPKPKKAKEKKQTPLDEMTKEELLAYAKENGIKLAKGLTRKEIYNKVKRG